MNCCTSHIVFKFDSFHANQLVWMPVLFWQGLEKCTWYGQDHLVSLYMLTILISQGHVSKLIVFSMVLKCCISSRLCVWCVCLCYNRCPHCFRSATWLNDLLHFGLADQAGDQLFMCRRKYFLFIRNMLLYFDEIVNFRCPNPMTNIFKGDGRKKYELFSETLW